MAGKKARLVEVLRLGNPWLVGESVGRISPLYTFHNLLAHTFKTHKSLQAVMHLTKDAGLALREGLGASFAISDADQQDLELSAQGVYASDRRVFGATSGAGASKTGSVFPVVGALVAGASDDGLGKNLRTLMSQEAGWRDRLATLMLPSQPQDPVTNLSCILLGGQPGEAEPSVAPASGQQAPPRLDGHCIQFIQNLTIPIEDARRLSVIRRLALGSYLVATVRMVTDPRDRGGMPPARVLVYCGMPPGAPHEPLVRAASKSYINWISDSWSQTAQRLLEVLERTQELPGTRAPERLRQRLHVALSARGGLSPAAVEGILGELQPSFQDRELCLEWCRELLSEGTGFTQAELARRVRSLGANIGFAGPDRGRGARLVLDAPILSVLVQGIVGNQAMELGDFVTAVAERFGLVLGVGSDDTLAGQLSDLGTEGCDIFELLVANQEALRERLVRAGLARTYSDSHTEVFCNA